MSDCASPETVALRAGTHHVLGEPVGHRVGAARDVMGHDQVANCQVLAPVVGLRRQPGDGLHVARRAGERDSAAPRTELEVGQPDIDLEPSFARFLRLWETMSSQSGRWSADVPIWAASARVSDACRSPRDIQSAQQKLGSSLPASVWPPGPTAITNCPRCREHVHFPIRGDVALRLGGDVPWALRKRFESGRIRCTLL